MLLRVELYGSLPPTWTEYIEHNEQVVTVSERPLILRLEGPARGERLEGVLSAMGRLGVPASAVYIKHPLPLSRARKLVARVNG